MDHRRYAGVVGGEDHLQQDKAARAFRLKCLARELIDVAPFAPILAHHERRIDRTAQHLGRTIPLILGDLFADLVVKRKDRL